MKKAEKIKVLDNLISRASELVYAENEPHIPIVNETLSFIRNTLEKTNASVWWHQVDGIDWFSFCGGNHKKAWYDGKEKFINVLKSIKNEVELYSSEEEEQIHVAANEENSNNKIHVKFTRLKLIFSCLLGIFTIIGSVIATIQYFKEDIIELEIKIIDKVQLTKDLNIEDLTIKYKDMNINNLWKIKYLISNTGKRNILGKGNKKDIFTENLPIKFKDSVKVLSTKIDDANFTISIDSADNILGLDFREWKNSKAVIITAIIENFSETAPYIYIDENDINDSKINIFEHNPAANKKLIERFANGIIFFILKWYTVFFIILLNIAFWGYFIWKDLLKKDSSKILKIISIAYYILSLAFVMLLLLSWIF